MHDPSAPGSGSEVLVVDYGVGNLGSVGRALKRNGRPFRLTDDPAAIAASRKLILPGVGHFGESMLNLRRLGLEEAIRAALEHGASLLGICVGFQMLFDESEEALGVPGLGFIEGRVRRFDASLRVPHIGWNQLERLSRKPLLEGVSEGDYFYFLHSYYVVPADSAAVWAVSDYGRAFCSVAGAGEVSGFQFHPEKSQTLGLRILENFCRA